jgi:hypothetical protein
MKDIKEELVEAISSGFIGLNGVQVFVDECSSFSSDEPVDDSWMVSHVTREYRPFSIQKIAEHLRNEINNDIMVLHQNSIQIDRMAFLLKEVPSRESYYTIKYVKVARKK